jgi:hypothetical protein
VAACSTGPTVNETITPEGKILQWESDDLLVIVSGIQPSYRLGESIKVNLLVNNQASRLAVVRLRTRLLTRGDQAVAETEIANLTVPSDDAANADREIPLARSLTPGEYTLAIEIPPWKVDGRDTGRPANIRSFIQLVRE